MRIDLQFKINSDPMLKRFIREYPTWYKTLNRDPSAFNNFVLDMKDKYKLKTSDKINRTLNNISLLQTFLDVLR